MPFDELRRAASRPGKPLTRRAALRQLGVSAVAATLAGCGGRGGAWAEPAPRRFARPSVAWDRVIRTVVGLRPFRPGGFVVRAEKYDDRLIVHDFGHGGGGVTLSWGTADMAVREALRTEHADVAVIGCGAVGLATARLLQRYGRTVTIYAERLPPETTSDIAGAQWAPFSVFDAEVATPEFRAQFVDATRRAYRHFQDLLGPRHGVRWIDNYFIGDDQPRLPAFMDELQDVFPGIESVPPRAHPFGTRHATRVVTMFVEPRRYLNAMMEDVRAAGGRIVVRSFRDPADILSLPERVVMNCTGLGSKALFGDPQLVPVKGQLTVLLPQPEVDYIVLAGGLYMFPRSDGILLGGTFQRGVWSLEPDAVETKRIVDGHRALFRA